MKCWLDSTQGRIVVVIAGALLIAAGCAMAWIYRRTAGKWTMRLFGFLTGAGVGLVIFGAVRLISG